MIAASALLSGDDATPALAAATVELALQRAGCSQAQEVILFLSPEFFRHVAPTLSAVSRTAGCLQIFGGIAAGLVSDETWVMDRPAVAALVLADMPALADLHHDQPLENTGSPLLSLCGKSHLPAQWMDEAGSFDAHLTLASESRFGLLYNDSLSSHDSPVWQGARLAIDAHASLRFDGLDTALGLSTGIATDEIGATVDAAEGHELFALGGARALDALRQALPPSLRQHRPLPVHCVCAVVRGPSDNTPHLIPILSANANGSVTLAEPVAPGATLAWSLRLPANAEADMRRMLDELVPQCPHPSFGLFLSCIGRGPFFYAGEDRDWALFRERFPGLPFVGAYGSGQIFSADHHHRLLQNSVITAVFSV